MRNRNLKSHIFRHSFLLCTPMLAWCVLSACSSSDSNSDAQGGTSGASGKSGSSSSSSGRGGSGDVFGGSAGIIEVSGGAPGAAGDLGAAGVAGDLGDGGMGGMPAELCSFHTPPGDEDSGSAGDGGSGGLDVGLVKASPIGSYLTDGHGHALYMFGSDQPGDCRHAPVATCVAAPCTQTWHPFFAGGRALAEGIDENFGDFTPTTAAPLQSTYNGWPLYTYVNEVPKSLGGEGIAMLWHAVTLPFYNVTLMKKKLSAALSVKYIADAAGYALYESSTDTAGAGTTKPVSACGAGCSADWPPFTLDRFVLPSSFMASDFSVFERSGGQLQVAYRGKPLYRFRSDHAPGDTLGNAMGTFVLADPAL